MVEKFVMNVERKKRMKNKELKIIHDVLDDYADIVFNDQDDYSEETIVGVTEALRIIKIEIEKATPIPKNPLTEYENGWRFIVWIGGVDDYYKNFSRAQMDYYNWVKKGYDDVVLTEIQKDGSEKILRDQNKVWLTVKD